MSFLVFVVESQRFRLISNCFPSGDARACKFSSPADPTALTARSRVDSNRPLSTSHRQIRGAMPPGVVDDIRCAVQIVWPSGVKPTTLPGSTSAFRHMGISGERAIAIPASNPPRIEIAQRNLLMTIVLHASPLATSHEQIQLRNRGSRGRDCGNCFQGISNFFSLCGFSYCFSDESV